VRALIVSQYLFKELSLDRHKSRGGERVLLTSLVSPTKIFVGICLSSDFWI